MNALHTLRHLSIGQELLQTVYRAVIVAKLSAWSPSSVVLGVPGYITLTG